MIIRLLKILFAKESGFKLFDRWRAEIRFQRKKYYLGVLKKDDAIKARQQAEEDLYGTFLEKQKNEYWKGRCYG